MDSVIRGLAIYVFLLLVFRVAGRRTLSEATTFDLVMLLIISETTQQAMVNTDHSMTNAFLLILTLVGTSLLLTALKIRFHGLAKWIDGLPIIVIKDGNVLKDRMNKLQVDNDDILEAARTLHGLERMEQIKHAVVERGGSISIVPKQTGTP
jgi:uncharacterized membrane protein YcaP (DUF421 family)